LAGRLLGRPELERLAAEPTLADLAEALHARGLAPAPPAAAEELELAARRTAGGYLRTLARWAPGAPAALGALFAAEELRSLRALLRGAAAGTAPAARLSGLLPTPELPERALAELARQAAPRELAALLVAWGHPLGPPLLAAAATARPDLLRIESALERATAARALAAARHGGRDLLAFTRASIDVDNAGAALALAAGGRGDLEPRPPAASGRGNLEPRGLLVTGGTLPPALFLAAARAGSPAAATLALAQSLRGSWLAAALA